MLSWHRWNVVLGLAVCIWSAEESLQVFAEEGCSIQCHVSSASAMDCQVLQAGLASGSGLQALELFMYPHQHEGSCQM